MKQEYNSFFDKVTPLLSDDELTQNLLRKERAMENKKKFTFRKPAAAVCAVFAALSLSIAGAAAIYTGIAYLSKTELAANEAVVEKIDTFIYEDSRKNMRMTVEEFLTDGRAAWMLIHYEALTEEGMEWFEKGMNIYGKLSMSGGHNERLINGGAGMDVDLKKYRTEKDRYFLLSRYDSDSTCNGKQDLFDEITLVYPMMTDRDATMNYTTYITVDDEYAVEIKKYKLIGDSGSEYYQLKYMTVSDLSLAIYGNGYGLTTKHEFLNGYWLNDNFHKVEDEISKTIYIIMADGSRIDTHYAGMGINENGISEEFDCNLSIGDGMFMHYNDENQWVPYSIKSENISALEINGIVYELEEIE